MYPPSKSIPIEIVSNTKHRAQRALLVGYSPHYDKLTPRGGKMGGTS